MASASGSRPEPGEYALFYETYISKVPPGDIQSTLAGQIENTQALLAGLPEPEAETLHAPYTWTIKDVLAHLIDSERIFGVRALWFARNDPSPLPGFDENHYVAQAHANQRPAVDLVDEFRLVRRSNLAFFRSLDESAWTRGGIANGNFVTVRALAHIIAGHEQHHIGIVRKRLAPR
jgi:hypothetical protein